MYIKNAPVIPKSKTYSCGGVTANWLIYEKHLPLLARDKGKFVFARTEALEAALKAMPFWYKVSSIF